MNAAAMAWIAGIVSDVSGCKEAWNLRSKRVRKRAARGVVSAQRVRRRGAIGSASPPARSMNGKGL